MSARTPRDSGTLVLARSEIEPGGELEEGAASCLILLHPPGPDIGTRMELSEMSYVIGRDDTCDLSIPRSAISRQHARMWQDLVKDWWVEDTGSTNGTFINEERIDRHKLRDGDQLRVGDTIFKFLSGRNIETAYHEEIYRMTIMDGLTGIYNKRYFLDFLEREMASAARHGNPLSLVMFDIDHFKRVNDERGHLAGDEVLKEVAQRIRPRVRREDVFARYGGEEFAAVLNVTALEGGVRFGEHLRNMVGGMPFEFDGRQFTVTISVGVATYLGETEATPESLIKRADGNLYEAKGRGRNCVVPSLVDLGHR